MEAPLFGSTFVSTFEYNTCILTDQCPYMPRVM